MSAQAEARIREKVGRHATGAGRDVRALSEIVGGEEVRAAAVVVWRKQGWILAATDQGVRLARHPWVLGSKTQKSFAWADLTAARSAAVGGDLEFGDTKLELLLSGPEAEFETLLDIARSQLQGADSSPAARDELRELARLKLGKLNAWGYKDCVDALPDRLQPGEEVQRLAVAQIDFEGLLVLTDRRLLLLRVGIRRGQEQFWTVDRRQISDAAAQDEGLLLQLTGESVLIVGFLPPERRDEFHVVLKRS